MSSCSTKPADWLALRWRLCYQLVNSISETVLSKTAGRRGLSPWLNFQLYQFVPKPAHDLLHQEDVNHPGRSWIREKVQGTCAASAQLMSWQTHHFPRRQAGIVASLGHSAFVCLPDWRACLLSCCLFLIVANVWDSILLVIILLHW